ncbi:hypothetical protein OAG75_01230 [bacterium]|jgi:hypothetical protein|nr:hypothetical protein [Planctomicrobium sp.]MDB4793243.1 hypothetical protein [bacterium]
MDISSPQPVEGGVSHRCQVLWGVTAKDRAAVFCHRFVANIMQTVFNRTPVIATECQ